VIKSKKWLATHLPGDRQLTQGLKVRPPGRLLGVTGPAVAGGRSLAADGCCDALQLAFG